MESFKYAKSYALIDLSSVVSKFFYTNADGPRERPTQQAIGRIAKESEGKKVIVLCDSKPYFRSQIDPAYKANRPEKDAEIEGVISMARRACEERWPTIAVDGYEADDLIASSITFLSAGIESKEIENVVIVSEDTDLLSQLRPGVIWRRVTPLKDETIDKRKRWDVYHDDMPLHPKVPVRPDQVVDYKVLTGDDNVKYFAGIGPKRAADLLKRFDYLSNIIASIDNFEEDDGEAYQVSPPTVRASIKAALEEKRVVGDEVMCLATMAVKMITPVPTVPLPIEVFDADFTIAQPIKEEPKQEQIQATNAQRGEIVLASKQAQIIPASEIAYRRELQPRSFEETMRVANVLFQSKAWPKLYKDGGGPQLVAALILWARDKNVSIIDALNGAHMIEGTIRFGAHMHIGLVKRSKRCEYLIYRESSSTKCVVETKRRGEPAPQIFTWTIEDAQRAKLTQKDNWSKYPAHMLRARCGMDAARAVYPDIVGASYATEDFDEVGQTPEH